MTDNVRADPILPAIDDLNRPFWEGCDAGELRLQACLDCGRVRYPVSAVCPTCLSSAAEWRTMSGTGEILSWVVFHQTYHPAWRSRTPYNVVIVQLPEGPRMFGNIEPLARTDLAVGAPVRVTFASPFDRSDDRAVEPGSRRIPRWVLAD